MLSKENIGRSLIMKKDIHAATPLQDAIKNLEEAIQHLDDIIQVARESQDFIKSLKILGENNGENIGWMDGPDKS